MLTPEGFVFVGEEGYWERYCRGETERDRERGKWSSTGEAPGAWLGGCRARVDSDRGELRVRMQREEEIGSIKAIERGSAYR